MPGILEFILEGLYKAWVVMWESEGAALFFAGALFAVFLLLILGVFQNKQVIRQYQEYARYAQIAAPEEVPAALPPGEEEIVVGNEPEEQAAVLYEEPRVRRSLKGDIKVAMNTLWVRMRSRGTLPNRKWVLAPNGRLVRSDLAPKVMPPKLGTTMAPKPEPEAGMAPKPLAPKPEPSVAPKPESRVVSGAKRVFNKLVPPPDRRQKKKKVETVETVETVEEETGPKLRRGSVSDIP